jgi:hypothetical protein
MKKILSGIFLGLFLAAGFAHAEEKLVQTSPQPEVKLVDINRTNEHLMNVDTSNNRINALERRMDGIERTLRALNDNLRDLQRDITDLRRSRRDSF